MNNSINYPNQQLPSYSGITINITNPNLTAPMSGNSYYIPQPNCNSCLPNNTTANNFAETPTTTQNKMTNPISAVPISPQNATSNVPEIAQYQVPQQNNSLENSSIQNKKNGLPQSYPSGYYIQNYNIQNPQKPQNIENQANIPNNNSAQEQIILNNSIPNKQENNTPYTIPAINSAPANATNNTLEEKQINKNEDENMDSSTEIINNLNNRVAAEKELEKNGKKTRIVALTNEYIMSLENYLNNPNKEIRLMAAKEILTRLDEDKTRFDDAALNALLNKMLQDPDKLVRIAALSAFSSQLASGNDFTIKLLNDIQNNPNAEKEDVLEAANILLKMSSSTEIRYTPIKNDTNSANKSNQEKNEKQIAQLQEQLQKYKQKEIEQMLAAESLK